MTVGTLPWGPDGNGVLPPLCSPKAGTTPVMDLKHVDRCEEGISTPSSPRVQNETEYVHGSEILGYIASGPALVFLIMNLVNPKELTFWIDEGLKARVLVSLWYFFVLGVESALQLSPVLQQIISANTKESTEEVLKNVKETETVKVEIIMKCYKEVKRGSDHMDLVWEGRSAFPIGALTDATDTTGGIETWRAVSISYDTRMEFADDRSKIDFERHVNRFEMENRKRGDAYELAYAVVLPHIRDGVPTLSFGDLSRRRPLRASLLGFYFFAAIGMTVPYRLAARRLVPEVTVTVVKRVSSVWPGRAKDCDFDQYPSVDYGA